QLLRETGSRVERRGSADEVGEPAVQLRPELRVVPGVDERLLQFLEGRHQRLGGEPAAVVAEAPGGIGPVESLGGHGRWVSLATFTKSRIRAGPFTPGDDSRPEEASTPNGRTRCTASATLSGSRPPARRNRRSRWAMASQSKVSPVPPGKVAWGVSMRRSSLGVSGGGSWPARTGWMTPRPKRRAAAAATPE